MGLTIDEVEIETVEGDAEATPVEESATAKGPCAALAARAAAEDRRRRLEVD